MTGEAARSFPYKIDSEDLRLFLKELLLGGEYGIGWVKREMKGGLRSTKYLQIKNIDKAVREGKEIVVVRDGWVRALYSNHGSGNSYFNQVGYDHAI
jgi:hypothetical protein